LASTSMMLYLCRSKDGSNCTKFSSVSSSTAKREHSCSISSSLSVSSYIPFKYSTWWPHAHVEWFSCCTKSFVPIPIYQQPITPVYSTTTISENSKGIFAGSVLLHNVNPRMWSSTTLTGSSSNLDWTGLTDLLRTTKIQTNLVHFLWL
jgi:hypothetical protein